MRAGTVPPYVRAEVAPPISGKAERAPHCKRPTTRLLGKQVGDLGSRRAPRGRAGREREAHDAIAVRAVRLEKLEHARVGLAARYMLARERGDDRARNVP